MSDLISRKALLDKINSCIYDTGSESDYDVYKLHIAINKAISVLKGE